MIPAHPPVELLEQDIEQLEEENRELKQALARIYEQVSAPLPLTSGPVYATLSRVKQISKRTLGIGNEKAQ
jgi:cell division septum initiation protein DivIVA